MNESLQPSSPKKTHATPGTNPTTIVSDQSKSSPPLRKLRSRDPSLCYDVNKLCKSSSKSSGNKGMPGIKRKILQNSNKNIFVSNLNRELDNEVLLTNLDKDFFMFNFNKCVNQITDSHHDILDAFMEKRDMEEELKKNTLIQYRKLRESLSLHTSTIKDFWIKIRYSIKK